MAGRAKRRSYREAVNCELELRPLMNVFIVLIPMLLMSAVFVEIRVIEMSQASAAAAVQPAAQTQPLELAVRILGDAYVIEGHGIASVSVPRPAADPARGRPGPEASAALARALAAIAAAHPGQPDVRIVAGAGTRYQEIVALMDLARAAGLSRAALQGAADGGI